MSRFIAFLLFSALLLGCLAEQSDQAVLQAPAKKTVTVQLQAGQELQVGGYTIAVQRIMADEVTLTLDGQSLTIVMGEQQTMQKSVVEVLSISDGTAQIRITER